MLAFIGDIHGEFAALQNIHNAVIQYPDITAIIQVGDFGFYPRLLQNLKQREFKIPVYAIDGNHESFPMLTRFTEVTEVHDNVFYVPRGTVLELDGRKVGFCGGAASVDEKLRKMYGMDWYPEEQITDADIAKFDGVETVDILVTHVPPQQVIQRHFDPRALLQFGLSQGWKDPSADKIEALWERFGNPTLICGHMHRSVVDKTVRILDINELFCM